MDELLELVDQAQRKIAEDHSAEGDWPDASVNRVYGTLIHGALYLRFDGVTYESGFETFIDLLCEPRVASSVRSVEFTGPDEGANGTRDWDFSNLCARDVVFPKLENFIVEPSPQEFHNFTIIADGYEESGQVAGLLSKMPILETLTVPSAPSGEFFSVGSQTLRSLRVDAGYDNQNFVRNLANSISFPKLSYLDYSEISTEIVADGEGTPALYDDYLALLSSSAFPSLFLVLRNPAIDDSEVSKLRRSSQGQQIRLIRTGASYVR